MSEPGPQRRRRPKGKVLKAHPVIPEPVRALVFAPSLRDAEHFAYEQGWTADEWRYIRKPDDLRGLVLQGAPRHLVGAPGGRMDNDGWKAWEELQRLTSAPQRIDLTSETSLF